MDFNADTLTLLIMFIAAIVPFGMLIWMYYTSKTKQMSLLHTKKVVRGALSDKLVYLGDDSAKLPDGTMYDATYYEAVVIEKEELPTHMNLLMKDCNDGTVFSLTGLNKKYNLIPLGGQFAEKRVWGCNIDRQNRIFSFNQLLVKKYKNLTDEILEDRLAAQEKKKLEETVEIKNLLTPNNQDLAGRVVERSLREEQNRGE
jgi:hypothetical protein